MYGIRTVMPRSVSSQIGSEIGPPDTIYTNEKLQSKMPELDAQKDHDRICLQ